VQAHEHPRPQVARGDAHGIVRHLDVGERPRQLDVGDLRGAEAVVAHHRDAKGAALVLEHQERKERAGDGKEAHPDGDDRASPPMCAVPRWCLARVMESR
jgi:hypothetical protein